MDATFFWFVAWLLILWILEGFQPARAWLASRTKRLFVHGMISLINSLIMHFLVMAWLFFFLGFVREKGWGLSTLLGLQGTAEIAATVILFDALEYGWHRFNHRIPFLWRFHRAHHLDIELDVTTAFRFHAGELLLSGVIKTFWILCWGPSITGFLAYHTCLVAFNQFHHSNIRLPDGLERWLRYIHITPRIHTSHHTVTQRSRDANFCVIFSLWDRVFGSYAEPDEEEMKTLGLNEGREVSLSLKAFFLSPFKNYEKTN
jgi:sterol desaturase/sphingolipid hydroxylase (fatty acid hydroxylase superfamily)